MNRTLLRDCLRSGTWASLAMMPFGMLFRALDLRIGHYGKVLLEQLTGPMSGPRFQIMLVIEHFIIGWISVVPLVWLWRHGAPAIATRLALGALYGAAYYLVFNAGLLPLAFGDRFPFQLGWSYVYPSLTVHLVFGVVAALALNRAAASKHLSVPA